MDKELQALMEKRLSPRRWRHSLGVAETADRLAAHWGVDPRKAYLAGILHDYAREIPRETLPGIAEAYGCQVLEPEREHPVVLHATVGAILAERELGIDDPEVLQAIARHTLGAADMSILDKIIFLADVIEPNRDYDGVEELRHLAVTDLNQAMLAALDYNIAYFIKKQELIHPLTMVTRESIAKEKERGQID